MTLPAEAVNSWGQAKEVVPAYIVDGSGLPVRTDPAGTLVVLTPYIESAAGTLTRPANTTAYAANDAVTDTGGAAVTLTVSEVNDVEVSLEAIRIRTADTGPGTATATFEAYIYSTAPTPATDNAAFTFPIAGYIGRFTGTFMAASDGSVATLVAATGSRRIAKPASGAKTFFVILKTLTAFTPSANSTTFSIIAEAFQGA